ncbi:MAG: sigma-70 family RNA polymerase sigma factor [Acidimicrobiales bacterium]
MATARHSLSAHLRAFEVNFQYPPLINFRININYVTWADNDLVTAMATNSADAYGELYRRHIDSVTSAAKVILKMGPESEDVATDVFIQLWTSPEKFDSTRSSVLGYLRMTAKHRSIDVIRSTTARRQREANDLRKEIVRAPDSDDRMIKSEESDLVRRSIAALPTGERQAIETAFYARMTYSAVAIHLGLAEGTVKARIRSGLQRLRADDRIKLLQEGDSLTSAQYPAVPISSNDVETI